MKTPIDPTEEVLLELNEAALKLVRANKDIKDSGLDHSTEAVKDMIEIVDENSLALSEVLLKLEKTL